MAIPVSTFYADNLKYINAVCDSYIAENTAAVARVLGPFLATMLGLYAAIWGVCLVRGLVKEAFNDFISRLLILLVVLAIGYNMANYNTLITNTFLRGPDEFIAGLARTPGQAGVVGALDTLFAQGMEIGARFWAKAGVLDGDFGAYIIAILVWAMTIVVTAYAFALMALSKVALAVLLAVGPLFFLGLLFEATAGYFNAWLRQMANYFLVPIMVVMVNLLILTLFSRAADGATAMTSTTDVAQVFPFMAMGFLSLLALASVLAIAGGLAGGVSLSSFGMGRMGAGLLKQAGSKAGMQTARIAGAGARGGAKAGRAVWRAAQNRKRNTVTPVRRPAPKALPYRP
jgi:type IV secretion system protein VirB6